MSSFENHQVAVFPYDNDVKVLTIDDPDTKWFILNYNNEIMLRKIHTYLINNKIIKNNIIDSGSWKGDNSIPWALNIASTNGTVYAIDPSKENCEYIKNTCELNKITNVKVMQFALNDKNETISTDEEIKFCSFSKHFTGVDGKNKTESYTLDHLLETNQIENIDLLHLDVEGMEMKAVIGSQKLIDSCRPIITFEQHLNQDDYVGLSKIIFNKNYQVFLINEHTPHHAPDCRNFMAFPNEIYSDKLIDDIHSYLNVKILKKLSLSS
jgi:FkbM family methyltransferase